MPALLGALGEELEASLPKQGMLLSCDKATAEESLQMRLAGY